MVSTISPFFIAEKFKFPLDEYLNISIMSNVLTINANIDFSKTTISQLPGVHGRNDPLSRSIYQ